MGTTEHDTVPEVAARLIGAIEAGDFDGFLACYAPGAVIWHNNDNLEQDYNRGNRESWIYKRDRLPKGIAFQEVRVDFVTKQGYGAGVLQKDPQPMQTLGLAAEAARRDKKLN